VRDPGKLRSFAEPLWCLRWCRWVLSVSASIRHTSRTKQELIQDPQQPKEDVQMKALCWHGKNDVRVDTVPDPTIQEATDAIIKITSTAICGSDLHLYDGLSCWELKKATCCGHEPMGIVVEVGGSVTKLKKGEPRGGAVCYCLRSLFLFCFQSSSIHAATRRIPTQKKQAS